MFLEGDDRPITAADRDYLLGVERLQRWCAPDAASLPTPGFHKSCRHHRAGRDEPDIASAPAHFNQLTPVVFNRALVHRADVALADANVNRSLRGEGQFHCSGHFMSVS